MRKQISSVGEVAISTDRYHARGSYISCPRNVALVTLALISPLLFLLQLSHDAAWQMWIGRQLFLGADLYTDIIEINPPLWFWIATPLSGVGEVTGIYGLHILLVAFLLAIVASIILSARMLSPSWSDRQQLIFFAALLIAVVPPGNFAQREHFTLISVIPYVLLIGRRNAGLDVPRNLAATIGVFAAVGLALKPHFALVPIALELWLRRPAVRPELVAVAMCGVAYALSVVWLEPDFFTNSAPLTLRAYGEFGQFRAAMLLPSLVPLIMALILNASPKGVPAAFIVASISFYLTFIIQQKGFAYQVMPAMGMLVLAVASNVSGQSVVRNAIAFAIAVLAILPNLAPYQTRPWADVPRGASYAALSIAPRAAWPLVEERGLEWPLRYMSLWMAPALGEELRTAVVSDIKCNPPAFLLVDDRQFPFSTLVPDILAHYSTVHQRNKVKFMKLERAFQRPRNCRAIH